MASNHSNRLTRYDNLFILLISASGIIGLTILHTKIYDVSIWEMVLGQGWFLVVLAVGFGIVSGLLRWRYSQHDFTRGLWGVLNLVVAFLLGLVMVKYVQVPLGWWLAMIQVGMHFLMKVVIDKSIIEKTD